MQLIFWCCSTGGITQGKPADIRGQQQDRDANPKKARLDRGKENVLPESLRDRGCPR